MLPQSLRRGRARGEHSPQIQCDPSSPGPHTENHCGGRRGWRGRGQPPSKRTTLPSTPACALAAAPPQLPPCWPPSLSSFPHSAPLSGLGHERAVAQRDSIFQNRAQPDPSPPLRPRPAPLLPEGAHVRASPHRHVCKNRQVLGFQASADGWVAGVSWTTFCPTNISETLRQPKPWASSCQPKDTLNMGEMAAGRMCQLHPCVQLLTSAAFQDSINTQLSISTGAIHEVPEHPHPNLAGLRWGLVRTRHLQPDPAGLAHFPGRDPDVCTGVVEAPLESWGCLRAGQDRAECAAAASLDLTWPALCWALTAW